MSTHLMIDIETLATTPDAVVLTIGGVKFDPFDESRGTWDPFYERLVIEEQEEHGRVISDSTANWWLENHPETLAEDIMDPTDRTPVDNVLEKLRKWQLHNDGYWAWGLDFDFKILEHLFLNYDRPVPWGHFYNKRCARTFCQIMPTDPRKALGTVSHNAVDDCIGQVYAVHKTMQHLGLDQNNCRI